MKKSLLPFLSIFLCNVCFSEENEIKTSSQSAYQKSEFILDLKTLNNIENSYTKNKEFMLLVEKERMNQFRINSFTYELLNQKKDTTQASADHMNNIIAENKQINKEIQNLTINVTEKNIQNFQDTKMLTSDGQNLEQFYLKKAQTCLIWYKARLTDTSDEKKKNISSKCTESYKTLKENFNLLLEKYKIDANKLFIQYEIRI